MSAVELRREGMQLAGTDLWLDATRKRPLSFVSHAHADHIARHEAVIATEATLRFMAHRLGAVPAPQPRRYREPFELGRNVLELFPAGHILGSAQLRVTRSDGTRVTFTGDLNTAPSLTAEPVEVAHCETLVIESTFGHPRFAFPPRAEVMGALEQWVRRCLEVEVTPVIWAYSLGKSQEALACLAKSGFSLCAHPSIYALTSLYSELGVALSPRLYDGTLAPHEVAVFPPRIRPFGLGRRTDVAILTGWAAEPGAHHRYRADRAFALSDHADCAGLVSYAKATGARTVVTHHGYARELADALQAAGIDAAPAGTREQLSLPF